MFFPPVYISLSDYSFCPNQSITAWCAVKKRNPSSSYLNWECDQKEGSGTVFCGSRLIDDFICGFGEVYNVTNNCNCHDPVIVSEVTFIAPQAGGNETLYCSNEIRNGHVFVSTQGKNRQGQNCKFSVARVD